MRRIPIAERVVEVFEDGVTAPVGVDLEDRSIPVGAAILRRAVKRAAGQRQARTGAAGTGRVHEHGVATAVRVDLEYRPSPVGAAVMRRPIQLAAGLYKARK